MVLDARRERPSPTPFVVPFTSAGATARPAHADYGAFGAVVVESERYELHVEHIEAHAPTRARVDRGRGVDVAIVIAGQKNGIASRDLKLLHACGCRRALLVVPPDVPEVVVENLGRHLLLGARYDADEMPVHQLARDPEDLFVADARALIDALDRCASPVAAGAFLASVTGGGGHAFVDGVRGTLARGAEVFVHGRPGGAWRHDVAAWSHEDVSAGDRLIVMGSALRDGVLAHEPLAFVREFDLAGTFNADDVSEMCFAFGGAAGFSEGRIQRGRVTLEHDIAPVDGRVGLVRFQGAVLGPVQSIELGALRTVREAGDDSDDTPEDARRPAGWTGDLD
jgi:hypothetical protein